MFVFPATNSTTAIFLLATLVLLCCSTLMMLCAWLHHESVMLCFIAFLNFRHIVDNNRKLFTLQNILEKYYNCNSDIIIVPLLQQ